jgi:hypothetical protein
MLMAILTVQDDKPLVIKHGTMVPLKPQERHVACGWSPSSAAVARVAAHSAVFAPFSALGG